jgi:O-antigen/teichoic acid export membrane protein
VTSIGRPRQIVAGALAGPAVLVVAMSINNAGIFGFHMIASRILGPARYGALGSLLALTLLLSVATTAITMAVVGQVAAHPDPTDWSVRGPARTLTGVVAILLVAGGASSRELARFLHLKSVVPVLLLLAYAAAVLAQVIARGIVLGSHRYRTVAGAIVSGTIVRLILGVALAAAFGTSGAIAAYTGAEATTAALLYMATHRRQQHRSRIPLKLPVPALALTIAAYGGIWLFSSTDTLLARHLLPGFDAGIYVAATTAGSIALWLPYNVTSSLFPRLVREATVLDGSRSFLIGAILAGAITVAAAIVMMLVPGFVISVLFGASYHGSAAVLVLLAMSNGLQGIAGFLLHHQLAHRRLTSLLPWVAVMSLAVLIEAHHPGPRGIAADAVVVSAGLALVMVGVSIWIGLRMATRPHQLATRPHQEEGQLAAIV